VEIEEIKANKKAIGGHTDDDQVFDTHLLHLTTGDTVYVCSDGFADQFGGTEDKKLQTKKFKEILMQIQSQTMEEQHLFLDNFIDNWKGKTEQTDDILVIGIRV
jgi:serine phosphatase RsbU (regulator of sigma subunit)